MTHPGTASPDQLAILAAALDDYCLEAGLGPLSAAREDAARLVFDLFNRGVDGLDYLKAALRARSRLEISRCA